ncbi:MAG: acetylxylan esterase [Verrucomicrobiota bacterium]
MFKLHLSPALFLITLATSFAPPAGFNYEESMVPEYTLPDPLVDETGDAITTADDWAQPRRPELLDLFASEVYGRLPNNLPDPAFNIASSDPNALDGIATRHQLEITFPTLENSPTLHLLVYTPNNQSDPVPAFLGLNFRGNHTIQDDPGITLSTAWMRPKGEGDVDNRATENSRGKSTERWPVERILDRGYALATLYYGDIDPDIDDQFQNGIHGAVESPSDRHPSSWGSIAAWAWGLSRALDALETLPAIDASQVAVLGHSRLGKTALWAGATDPRFALVISNNSGCGGAALSRRAFGETVARINTNFPHWFCDNFKKYNDNESALPVDQHQLIALSAPRPVYVASATEDQWADPNGEFLSAKNAEPVYQLLNQPTNLPDTQPPPDTPVGQSIGYHLRTGKHDLAEYDWEQYLNFADLHFNEG